MYLDVNAKRTAEEWREKSENKPKTTPMLMSSE